MRRCKYYKKEIKPHFVNKELFINWYLYCSFDDSEGCIILHENCIHYTPVEIDPYWKDIVDETNKRLNNEK